MSRPRLLDLYCGAGGAAMGYARAGFDVVGVDVVRQPRYPFPFVRGDALDLPVRLDAFDAVHASPPCQAYSDLRTVHRDRDYDETLLDRTRTLLSTLGVPWIIENVEGSYLRNAVVLCGAAFGLATSDDDGTPLVLRRHRLFESNVVLFQPSCDCRHFRRRAHRVAGVYGNGPQEHVPGARRGGYVPRADVRRALMGIDWMNRDELSQAIPPAYTQFLGEQLIRFVEVAA